MKLHELKAIVGGLSAPSKMPGYAYGIPAQLCQVGQRLAKIKGSTCSKCYADNRGNYRFGRVKRAQKRRYDTVMRALKNPKARALWVDSMTALIQHYSPDYFRWHDSGDLQSAQHLALIVDVCTRTRACKHWIPTREYAHVLTYLVNGGMIPRNLCVRLSAHMVDGKAPRGYGLPTSAVHKSARAIGRSCPAGTQGNSCGDCRACWSKRIRNVSYPIH